MIRRLLFVCIALLSLVIAKAQDRTIRGTVTDQKTKAPLASATVKLSSLSDSTLKRNVLTDSAGKFSFGGLTKDSFLLSISYVGYNSISRIVAVDTSDINLKIAAVVGTNADLATVIITTTISPVTQKQDTVQFNASQYKVNPDASAEDLVKKMPGITVQNGSVTANGENVQKVTIDGRELFGDDATAALRNLPAEVIDKIQVFDRLSDQAQFTGFDDGNSQKSINIITKANMRNGQFGRLFGGYGTSDRYNAGGNTTLLHGDQKISLVGNFNNINQQNFATQDLLGVSNNGGQRGGGGGGGGFRGGGGGGQRGGGGGGQRGGGGFGANSNFLVGQQSGINKTNSFGINYADNWGKKLQVTGSYFFNNSRNLTEQISNLQYYVEGVHNNVDTTSSVASNNNHRVNLRFDYKIDSANEIIFTPSLNFQSNETVRHDLLTYYSNSGVSINSINTATNAKTSGNSLNNNFLIRHAFHKRGRTLSLNLNQSSNKRDGENYLSQLFHNFSVIIPDSSVNEYIPQHNNGYQLSANLVYTEPIGKSGQLQLNYNPTYSNSKADQETYFMDADKKFSHLDDSLSNKFNSEYKTQNGGIAYRYGNRDNQISIGANYQHTDLSSDQIFPYEFNLNKTFNNILPNAMARLKLSTRSSLRVFYRASANQPSVTQLQDVVDKISNSPYVVMGNPNLAQQTNNLLSTRYTFTNPGKGTLFVANIFLQNAQNYISNATYIPVRGDSIIAHGDTLLQGQQLTVPVNMDGYLSLRSFLTFAIPIKPIKSQLNFNGGVSYSRLPGITNNITNKANSITYTSGVVIASNISQYVDFTISYSANFNQVKNSNPELTNSNTHYFSHTAGAALNLLSKKGWFYQTDLTNNLTSGYAQGFNQNYFLWNMGAGKKFLKNQRGELKLSVFDVLGQNRSIVRNVTETYIQDVQNIVLRRYAMLTFTYTLRTFGQAAAKPMNRGNFNNGGNYPRF